MRKNIPASIYNAEHPDFATVDTIERDIVSASSGLKALRVFFREMLRDEIDKLIDSPNTDRRSYDDLEKVEKTYIGTRVEIRLRKFWGYPKGRLDLRIQHIDVDIKHTMESGWMIPREALDEVCVLSAADENTAKCYLGLIVAKREYLTKGPNQDKKLQIAAPEWKNIRWLIFEEDYPPNFWKTVRLNTVSHIFEGSSGMERVRRLFRTVLDRPIPRKVIVDAAQQLDPLKRIRRNGGARDQMMEEGVLILSGNYDRALIAALKLPACSKDEFISHCISTNVEKKIAARFGIHLQ
jgi:hypothetical protein